MATSLDTKLHELLADFGVAMRATHTVDGQLRARPMALAEVEPDGTLWFLTDRHSSEIGEIAKDDRVLVTMQSSARFVSLSGTMAAVGPHRTRSCAVSALHCLSLAVAVAVCPCCRCRPPQVD